MFLLIDENNDGCATYFKGDYEELTESSYGEGIGIGNIRVFDLRELPDEEDCDEIYEYNNETNEWDTLELA